MLAIWQEWIQALTDGAGFNITCYICPVKSGEKYTATNTYGGNFQENGTGQETIVGVFALTNGS